MALVLPSRGGQLVELDVRRIEHNLLATLTRQPEAYHRKILAGATARASCASIHERVVFKQADLDQRIQYDAYPRKSLLDLFYDHDTTLDAVAAGRAAVGAISPTRVYQARIRRNPDRIQVQLSRDRHRLRRARADHQGPDAGRRQRDAPDRLPAGKPAAGPAALVRRRAELCRAARRGRRPLLPRPRRQSPGPARRRLDLGDAMGLGLVDEWLGHRRGPDGLRGPRTSGPSRSRRVSQSEGGFEVGTNRRSCNRTGTLRADREGRWAVSLELVLDTGRAEPHRTEQVAAAVTG